MSGSRVPRVAPNVHTRLTDAWPESLFLQIPVNDLILLSWTLPQSLDASLQLANIVLETRSRESRGLLHVHGLFELSVQERRLDVHMMYLHVKRRRE